MNDLGLSDFELDVRSYLSGFRYHIMFRFVSTRGVYSHTGTAASPGECYEQAMVYLAESMREAV